MSECVCVCVCVCVRACVRAHVCVCVTNSYLLPDYCLLTVSDHLKFVSAPWSSSLGHPREHYRLREACVLHG